MYNSVIPTPKRHRAWVVTALLSSTFAVTPALAQSVPMEPTSGQDNGDIIVTAQKRSETLQSVPISIQALGTATLAQHQVASFDDYAKLLPSVSYQSFGPGQSQIFFRGVSSGHDTSKNGSLPGSGLYLDEIPVSTIAGSLDVHVYDLARVEALSGPQGTLFGASSLAGTLRLITNQPDTKKFSAGFDIQGNTFGRGRNSSGGGLEGYVNIPLSDRAALRIVGFYDHTGGYISNVPGTRKYTLGDADPTNDIVVNNSKYVKTNFNDTDTYGGRAALKIDLNESWTVTPAIIYQHEKANGNFLYDPKVGDLAVTDYSPDYNTDDWFQAALTIHGKLSNWDVVYAGGYFERKVDNQTDYSNYTVYYDSQPGYTKFPTSSGSFLDPTQLYISSDKYTKQTHELRVSSPSTDRLRLVAGAYYQRQTDADRSDYLVPGLASIPSSPAIPKAGDDIYLVKVYRVDRDYAMFGEASFDVTPKLTVTAGLRGFISRNSLYGFSGSLSKTKKANCLLTTDPGLYCANVHSPDGTNTPHFVDQSGETHKLNLTYKFDRDHLLYATYSTGYRPGGVNRTQGAPTYQADTLINYELGFKTSWFDRRLRVNGAVFIENWKGLQYTLTSVGDNGGTNVYNAGNARVHGVEGDFSLRIIDGLTLSGAGTYIDAKLTTNFCTINATAAVRFEDCTLGIAAPAGTPLPIQPKLKGNLTARYETTVGHTKAFIQGSVNHQSSSRSYLTTNTAIGLGQVPEHTAADFSVGGEFGGWTVEAFVQNAFDTHAALSFNSACDPELCSAYARNYPVRPRLFGFKIGSKF